MYVCILPTCACVCFRILIIFFSFNIYFPPFGSVTINGNTTWLILSPPYLTSLPPFACVICSILLLLLYDCGDDDTPNIHLFITTSIHFVVYHLELSSYIVVYHWSMSLVRVSFFPLSVCFNFVCFFSHWCISSIASTIFTLVCMFIVCLNV